MEQRRQDAHRSASMGPGTRVHGSVARKPLAKETETARLNRESRDRRVVLIGAAAALTALAAEGILTADERVESRPATDGELRANGWKEADIDAFRQWEQDQGVNFLDTDPSDTTVVVGPNK